MAVNNITRPTRRMITPFAITRARCALLPALVVPLLLAEPATATEACELHVWPTESVAAAFSGVVLLPDKGPLIGPEQRALLDASERLRGALDPAAQLDLINASAALRARFPGYRIVPHPARSDLAPHWLDKNFGTGPRETSSTAKCYVELSVIFATLLKRNLNKKLQTVFLLRIANTGAAPLERVIDGVGTSAPAFTVEGEANAPATESIRNAFTANLTGFLDRGKVRKLVPPHVTVR